ncbi:MAG: hypothetical protein QOK48_184 [Blastocatellia bacterium]|nr:hypothetical protein [Blastocatellia bacterium]
MCWTNRVGDASVIGKEVVLRKSESFHQADQLFDQLPLQDVCFGSNLRWSLSQMGMVSKNTALTLDPSINWIGLYEGGAVKVGKIYVFWNAVPKKLFIYDVVDENL